MQQIEKAHIKKLLCAQSPDAALLYLYLLDGGNADSAQQQLGFSPSRYACACATLRQLGLLPDTKPIRMLGEQPRYTELDVLQAGDNDLDFRALCDEVQRQLGKHLNTEELKILLGFVRYLGFDADVIVMLIAYCKERAKNMGKTRNPSLRTFEKEAYAWAEMGIDTMEEAAQYIRRQQLRFSQTGQIMQVLQIRGRNLTAPEERYIRQWLDMGFDKDAIGLAYERSCLNTGGLSWPYINKILQRWHEQGLHTLAQIRSGDSKPAIPRGASGELGEEELAAIQKMMQGG